MEFINSQEHTNIFEEGEFLLYCTAWQVEGKFVSSVTFERKADQSKTFVPSVRYRLTGVVFHHEGDALQQALDHGIALVKAGKVEFE